jgi:hypothetical protein
MMVAQTSHSEFSAEFPAEFHAGRWHGWHFDLVQVSTIAIGIVVMTALAMMF